MSLGWRWWAAIGAAVLLLGVLIYVALRGKNETKKEARPIGAHPMASAPTPGPTKVADESILVFIVTDGDAIGVGRTLMSLFSSATAPFRVFVGLCEVYDNTTDSSIAEYEQAARQSKMPYVHTRQIRTIRIPRIESNGSMAARSLLERHVWSGETYVMTLACHARLAPGWDVELVKCYKEAQQVVGSPTVMLTTRPRSVPLDLIDNPHVRPAITNIGTFVFLSDGGTFRGSTFASVPETPVIPALGWSWPLSFSSSARLQDVPTPAHMVDADDAEDFWMSSRLLRASYALLHPAKEVAVAAVEAMTSSGTWETPKLAPEEAMGLMQFMARLGLGDSTPQFQLAQVRAKKGLTPDCARAELMSKLGSEEELRSLVSRLELHRDRVSSVSSSSA